MIKRRYATLCCLFLVSLKGEFSMLPKRYSGVLMCPHRPFPHSLATTTTTSSSMSRSFLETPDHNASFMSAADPQAAKVDALVLALVESDAIEFLMQVLERQMRAQRSRRYAPLPLNVCSKALRSSAVVRAPLARRKTASPLRRWRRTAENAIARAVCSCKPHACAHTRSR